MCSNILGNIISAACKDFYILYKFLFENSFGNTFPSGIYTIMCVCVLFSNWSSYDVIS